MAELRTESRIEWPSAPRETGDRDFTCGHDSFQVPGDGHGGRPSGSQPLSLQPPESGCLPHPALVPSGPRVLELCLQPIIRSPHGTPLSSASAYTPYSILSSPANWPTDQPINSFVAFCSTEPQSLLASHLYPLPTGQLVNWSTNLSYTPYSILWSHPPS